MQSLSLLTAKPIGFIFFCFVLALGYVWLMYRKPVEFESSPTLYRGLMLLRFLLIFLLSFLLLEPLINRLSNEKEKPVLVLALDASASMVIGKDSGALRAAIIDQLEKVQEGLSEQYELRTFSFGSGVREGGDSSFADAQTDFSQLYAELDVRFANRNVGALVLFSDGIYTEGSSPVYGPARLKVPVYPMAFGDTSVRKDLAISRVDHNRTAYLGNEFPVEITLAATQCAGSRVRLRMLEDSTEVFSRMLDISGSSYTQSVPVFLKAGSKGIKSYRVEVDRLDGEVTLINNSTELFIEVIEKKNKVLILASAPHPDLSALKNALENNPNYEVSIPRDLKTPPAGFSADLIILHNLAGKEAWVGPFMKEMTEKGKGMWVVVGPGLSSANFNALASGVEISQAQNKGNEVFAQAAGDFSLFSLPEDFTRSLQQYPPLIAGFGDYGMNGNVSVLFWQRIGQVSTRQPLFWLRQESGKREAWLAAEGIWTWRLRDFKENGSHLIFDDWVSRIAQFLLASENTSPFRVHTRARFKEGEALYFDAELYNEAGELMNSPEVNMLLINKNKDRFTYTFNRTEKAYSLLAGKFPPGTYTYQAEVNRGDRIFKAAGTVTVSGLPIEKALSRADHQALYSLAQRSGGQLFFAGQASDLVEAIKRREDIKTLTYSRKKTEDWLSVPLVLLVLASLFSIEWFLRKRSGSY